MIVSCERISIAMPVQNITTARLHTLSAARLVRLLASPHQLLASHRQRHRRQEVALPLHLREHVKLQVALSLCLVMATVLPPISARFLINRT
jgi:hypothetical protein